MPLGLYKDLMRSATPMTVEQLAEEAKAQPLLVGTIASLVDLMREAYTDSIARVLRVISVVELVNEVDRDLYAASPVTEVMASTAMTAAGKALVSLTLYPHSILEPDRSSWDQSANSMAKFPEFLEQREFSCPSDPEDGLFQYAFGTRLGAFEHWSRDAKVFDNFNVYDNSMCMTISMCISAASTGWTSRGSVGILSSRGFWKDSIRARQSLWILEAARDKTSMNFPRRSRRSMAD